MQGAEKIKEFITKLTGWMGISCEISVTETEHSPVAITLTAANDGNLLIGKNGQNLKAFEHLIRIAWLRAGGQQSLTVDINEYRRIRTEELRTTIQQIAERVSLSRKAETLEPMTAYERRIAHTELASYRDITTESIGQEPHRRVVIRPL